MKLNRSATVEKLQEAQRWLFSATEFDVTDTEKIEKFHAISECLDAILKDASDSKILEMIQLIDPKLAVKA